MFGETGFFKRSISFPSGRNTRYEMLNHGPSRQSGRRRNPPAESSYLKTLHNSSRISFEFDKHATAQQRKNQGQATNVHAAPDLSRIFVLLQLPSAFAHLRLSFYSSPLSRILCYVVILPIGEHAVTQLHSFQFNGSCRSGALRSGVSQFLNATGEFRPSTNAN